MYQPAHPGKWNPEAPCYGRFYFDEPGDPERKRRTVPLGVCRTKTIARRLLREYIERTGINSQRTFREGTAPDLTFAEQAERWIRSLPTRRRRPVKPATIANWRHSLDKWLLPLIGENPLRDVGNAVLKKVIDKMTAAGLSAKTVVEHTRPIKMIVASLVDAEGNQIYPRVWNHDFVGMPIVDPTKQRRPTVTRAELESILERARPRYRMLFALLAATGLRIGECLGLCVEDFSPDCRVLHVKRSVWRCREQTPKTPNAARVVDIPEQLAAVLREYIIGRHGLLFATRDRKPFSQRNVLRAFHAAGATCGFHSLRRFRTETLRKEGVPEHLLRQWLGWHSTRSLTDLYAEGLKKDQALRQEWCERAGLGFSLNGLRGVTDSVSVETEKAA